MARRPVSAEDKAWKKSLAAKDETQRRRELFNAVSKGQHGRAATLLAMGLSPDMQCEYGRRICVKQPLLHIAIDRGDERMVDLLLDRGADPDIPNEIADVPLVKAAQSGRKSIVRLLMKYNADPRQKDEVHGTALQAAAARGHESVVTLLKRYERRLPRPE